MSLRIDFETKSNVPIANGLMKYFAGKDADILFATYSLGNTPAKVWFPGDPIPEEFYATPKYAQNAIFDWLVWNLLGQKYGLAYSPLCHWIDVMGLCGRFAYPLGLANACDALDVEVKKNPRGKLLISKICKPPYNYTQAEWDEFVTYGLDDVNAMNCVLEALPSKKLTTFEQWVWLQTQAINLRGLPVDSVSAKQIITIVEFYKQEIVSRLPEISDGRITAATQVQRIKAECKMHGVVLPNMQAPTIERYLETENPHPIVAELLMIRADIGGTATKKYHTLLDQHVNDRIYFNLVYHAATTGRFAGRGFQVHNLTKAKTDDPEGLIAKFMNLEEIENIVLAAKKLIRPMICAPEGKMLMVADFDSIETVLLMWLIDDLEALAVLASGDKLYYHMAAFLYNKDPKDIDKSSIEYAMGKALILGCGYGMGWKRFMATAVDFGLDLTEFEAREAVEAYRTKYRKVKAAWYALKNAAEGAIRNPGNKIVVHKCAFTLKGKNLWVRLPSGRSLFYADAGIDHEGLYHYGLNTYNYKWEKKRLIPGRLMENIIQGLARDYLCKGMFEAEEQMPEADIIFHVHDEIATEINIDIATPETLEKFCTIICPRKEWMETIPMKAEGYIERRFKKD